MAEAFAVDLHGRTVAICEGAGDTVPEITGPEVFEAAIDAAEANIHMMLSMLREALDPKAVGFPPASAEFARTCARAGLTMQTLMRIGNAGFSVLWRDWTTAMRDQTDDEALLADALASIAQFLWAYIDMLYAHWAEEYMLERDRWIRSREALRTETIQAILDGRPVDAATAGKRLGYDLGRSHRAFVVWTDTKDDEVLSNLERHAAAVARCIRDEEPLLLPRGRGEVAGWLASTEPVPVTPTRRRLLASAGGTLQVAFGGVHGGIDGFRRSYTEALETARVVRLGPKRPARVVEYHSVSLVALLTADEAQARLFVDAELGALAADDDATLRIAATVRVFLQEQRSPKRAAARLGIHENTVTYRIRQAEQLLGRPVDERRLELETALAIATALRQPDGEGD
jgi:DNA-binding PucR family transcriptional regulator